MRKPRLLETAADADVGQTRRLLTPRPGPPLLPAATWVGSWSRNCNFLSREEHRLSALCKPLSCVLRQGVRQVPLSSSFAREETEAQEKSPSGMEEPQPRAGSNRELTFSRTSASTAPHPGAPQEQHPRVIPLAVPSTQLTGSGRRAVAGFCGIEWKLPSLTPCHHTSAVHGFAHMHIPPTRPSVRLMHRLTATLTHTSVHITKAQAADIQREEINAQLPAPSP